MSLDLSLDMSLDLSLDFDRPDVREPRRLLLPPLVPDFLLDAGAEDELRFELDVGGVSS